MVRYLFHYEKCIFLLCMVTVTVQIESQELYKLSPIELLQVLFQAVQIRDGDVQDSDLTFYLLTRTNKDNPTLISKWNNDQVDVNKPTKIIVHGYIENYRVEWYKEMKNEFLKYEDANIIWTDWERVAKSFYYSSARNCELIGEILGRFIISLNFPAENIHLIGHSLGAQVSAFAAKYVRRVTGEQIRRITALDPAGPFFQLPLVDDFGRLNSDDADIVVVIHTDGTGFGFFDPCGTLDIYVNGGVRKQPGCHEGTLSLDYHELLKSAFCSHSRSHEYFIQSIHNADILCGKCQSLEDVTNKGCSVGDFYRIEHQNVTQDMKGICMVNTTSTPPYFVN